MPILDHGSFGKEIDNQIFFLQHQLSQHPYIGWEGMPFTYLDRIETSLATLPKKYYSAAISLFSSVVYLPKMWLDEIWRGVALELMLLNSSHKMDFKNALILAVDDPGILTNFTRVAKIPGREDSDNNPNFGTTSKLIDALLYLTLSNNDLGLLNSVKVAVNKKWWVLLADNVISGGSAKNEVEKLHKIRGLLYQSQNIRFEPKIVLCTQVVTQHALNVLNVFTNVPIIYGLKFDDTYRINSKDCSLYKRQSTLNQVRELCEWFGDDFFLNCSQKAFQGRLNLHRKKGGQFNYAYGWRDGGYTIVTQDNCLSNSVPLLSYIAGNDSTLRYTPPFPRIESRVSHALPKDLNSIGLIESNLGSLKTKLL